MAIFEKRSEQKVRLDDTQIVTCVIETAQKVNGHTEYVLRIQRGPLKENSWIILRRYNDFAELNKSLQHSKIPLPMPGKKVIGNMRPDFIAERRHALQKYINAVLMNPILASSLPAKKFVDPDSYSSSFHDQAVQNASMCLRTEGFYVLGHTLGPIGWRLRKHYFKAFPKPPGQSGSKHNLIKLSSQSHNKHHISATTTTPTNGSTTTKTSSSATTTQTTTATDSNNSSLGDLVLTWTEYGPDKYIDEKEMNSIFKSLVGLQHSYIEPIRYAIVNESGCLVIRRFYKHGSLKDMICMSTPKNPFLSKYGNPKGRTALSLKQVASYGAQILDALRFLHSKGMPYGHLQSGNIIIVDETVKLLDIENFVLGVPAFYRPFFVQHSKIHTPETIDVYCFGHVLFEMSMGYPLQESVARQITDCPDSLKNLLESVLSKEACKSGLPTLDQLAEHKFFIEFGPYVISSSQMMYREQHSSGSNKPHFKLSMNAKEQIRVATQKSETRLRDEQKSVKNQKRLVRVQELMSSEEEKKKSKQKAKLEHRQSKLKQQSSLQMYNVLVELPPGSPLNRSDSILSVSASHETLPTPPASVHSVSSLTLPPQLPPFPSQVTAQQRCDPKLPAAAAVDESDGNGTSSGGEHNRSALLESICRFNRGSLRKVRSND